MPTIRKGPNEIRVANLSASFSTYRGPLGSEPAVLTTQYSSREEVSGFASLAAPIQDMWLSTLVKPDAMEQVFKTRIAAEGIKDGVHL